MTIKELKENFAEIQEKWKNDWLAYLNTSGYNNNSLYIKNIPKKGIGVFAAKHFNIGDVVEMSPLICLNRHKNTYTEDVPHIPQYCYWDDNGFGGVACGYGSFFNCSHNKRHMNVGYVTFYRERVVVYYALKQIKKDEELLTWWGRDYYYYWCKKPNIFEKTMWELTFCLRSLLQRALMYLQ